MEPRHLAHPSYVYFRKRLDSFASWPPQMRPKPCDLAHAGYFYTNLSDKVCCFACGLMMHDWNRDDDPWLEHHRHTRHCVYLKMVGGVRLWSESSTCQESRRNPRENSNASTSAKVFLRKDIALGIDEPDADALGMNKDYSQA